MADVMRPSVSGRELAALGCGGRAPPMLVASVGPWRREADGATGRPRSGLEGGPGATETRQLASRARGIRTSVIPDGHGVVLGDHDLLDSTARQVEQAVELVASERLSLRSRLYLDQAPVRGHHDVHVGVGCGVL